VVYTFHGASVGWVSWRGPTRGLAEVSVDGGPAVVLDLYAATDQPRNIVFAASDLDPTQEHTLTVRVLGRKGMGSSTRVDIDGFIALQTG
jgi:hypothetical protein